MGEKKRKSNIFSRNNNFPPPPRSRLSTENELLKPTVKIPSGERKTQLSEARKCCRVSNVNMNETKMIKFLLPPPPTLFTQQFSHTTFAQFSMINIFSFGFSSPFSRSYSLASRRHRFPYPHHFNSFAALSRLCDERKENVL